MNTDDLS